MSQSLDRIRVGWIALALLALLGTACGDKDDGAGTASDATIVSFTVEPESIVEGDLRAGRLTDKLCEVMKSRRLVYCGLGCGCSVLLRVGALLVSMCQVFS